MAPKKQSTTGEGTTSKGKSVATAGNIIPPESIGPIIEDIISALSQVTTGDIHPPSIYEAQLLQMFADMKEELTKQQALFDCEWEQAEHDREHAAREREEMKHLNDQLPAQIAILQNTRVPLSPPEKASASEATSDEQSQSRRRCRATSLHQSNSTTSQVLIPARRIDMISLRGELRQCPRSRQACTRVSRRSEHATSPQI